MNQYNVAVLLLAYGGLDSLDNLETYLKNILGGRQPSPGMLQEMRHRYALIGGRSPLLEITHLQAKALEAHLNHRSKSATIYRSYVGMRHWNPTIEEALTQIIQDGIQEVVAVCMAPHYSEISIGAYRSKLQAAQTALGPAGEALSIHFVNNWHDHPGFIQVHTDKIEEKRRQYHNGSWRSVKVLFTAHSLPLTRLEGDDPYIVQVEETAQRIAQKLNLPDDQWQICYQSIPNRREEWLGPHLGEKTIKQLAANEWCNILLVPIGFVADHVEILYDIDIEAASLAEKQGIQLDRTDSLNTTPQFIAALADIVNNAFPITDIQPTRL